MRVRVLLRLEDGSVVPALLELRDCEVRVLPLTPENMQMLIDEVALALRPKLGDRAEKCRPTVVEVFLGKPQPPLDSDYCREAAEEIIRQVRSILGMPS